MEDVSEEWNMKMSRKLPSALRGDFGTNNED